MLPGQANAGSALFSGRALSCPGCPGSSAGRACPLIPSRVLMVHPRGSRAAVWDGGWVSSELQRRDWCKCEEIGCMDERTKKSESWGYKKAKGWAKDCRREGRAGQAHPPTSWECSNSTPVSQLEAAPARQSKITRSRSFDRGYDEDVMSHLVGVWCLFSPSFVFSGTKCAVASVGLCVWQQALWDVILCCMLQWISV